MPRFIQAFKSKLPFEQSGHFMALMNWFIRLKFIMMLQSGGTVSDAAGGSCSSVLLGDVGSEFW